MEDRAEGSSQEAEKKEERERNEPGDPRLTPSSREENPEGGGDR